MTPRQILKAAADEINRAERLLEVAQAARRLKRCDEQVRRYIRAGLLRAERTPGKGRGGNYLIPESAIAEFLVASRNMMRHTSP